MVESLFRRYEAAFAVLNALHAIAPQHPQGLVARALVLKRLERLDEALDCARQAVALAPHRADTHNALGQVLQHLGRCEEAMSAFETAATLPGSVAEEALIGRATLLMEAGRKDEALAAFDRVLAQFPRLRAGAGEPGGCQDVQGRRPGHPGAGSGACRR